MSFAARFTSTYGNKCYTDNDVIVYNIFAYNIPGKVTEEDTLAYFSKFGDVVKVVLSDNNKGSTALKWAFVNFYDPAGAAKALQEANHQLQSRQIFVQACGRWNQPKPQQDDETTNQPSLLQLNDDCLEHIFKLLKLSDRFHLACACQRLRIVWQMACKLEYKAIRSNCLKGLTFCEVPEFFKLAGPNIETFGLGFDLAEDSSMTEQKVMCVANFCPNVKSFSFECENIRQPCLHQFLERMNSLIELEIQNFELMDEDILAISKLSNLESLNLSKNWNLTGQHLDKLVNIRNLNLGGCYGMQSNDFIRMCKSMKELKSLNIKWCELPEDAVNGMLTHCHNLEILKMSSSEECIALLPKLKSLQIKDNNFRRHSFSMVAALAEHAQQLEYLTIVARNWIQYDVAVKIASLTRLKKLHCVENKALDDKCLRKLAELENLEEIDLSSCNRITNNGLLYLISRCVNLRYVFVQYCEKITDAFVSKAIEVLKQRQKQQTKSMSIHVSGCAVRELAIELCTTNAYLNLSNKRQQIEDWSEDDSIEEEYYHRHRFDDSYDQTSESDLEYDF